MIGRIVGAAVIVLVVAGVVLAFLLIGGPAHTRQLAMDRVRVADLETIRQALSFYGTHEKWALPASLAVVRGHISDNFETRDPETTQPYEYRVLSPKRYMLCATFALPQQRDNDNDDGGFGHDRGPWLHGAGHTCYTITFPGNRIVGASH